MPDVKMLEYSALDSACTFEIHDGFWPDLGDEFTPAVDMTMAILPVLMFMQTRGVSVSRDLLEETKKDVIQATKEKQAELEILCGRPLNVNSTKDCQTYFYDELGIPPYKNQGRITCDDMALQRLVRGTATRPGLRQAKLVQDIRGLQKLYGTYLNIEFDADGRMRGSYNPRGTKFGRLSSSKTIFGTGTNFQNLPQDFKKFLVADHGYCFLEVDKRQAEWVVVAYASGDANMISAVEEGKDVHVHTAELMFHASAEVIKYEHKLVGHFTDSDTIRTLRLNDEFVSQGMVGSQWPRTMSLRQCGKKSNHGLNYDEGYKGFAMINEIDEKEANRIVNMYHTIYPGIRIWYESIKRSLQKDRTLTNCFGRTVRFLDAWDRDLWRAAYSMIPQATVVDSLNSGMVKIYNDNELCGTGGYNMDVLAQVHDSILLQVPITFLAKFYDSITDKITDYTSPMLSYNGRDFKIASDYKVGLNWGGYNKDKNPNGMVEVNNHEEFMAQLAEWEKLNGTATC